MPTLTISRRAWGATFILAASMAFAGGVATASSLSKGLHYFAACEPYNKIVNVSALVMLYDNKGGFEGGGRYYTLENQCGQQEEFLCGESDAATMGDTESMMKQGTIPFWCHRDRPKFKQ